MGNSSKASEVFRLNDVARVLVHKKILTHEEAARLLEHDRERILAMDEEFRVERAKESNLSEALVEIHNDMLKSRQRDIREP